MSTPKIAIGLDLGASNLRGALIKKSGKIIKKIEAPTPNTGPSGRIVTEKIIDLVDNLIQDYDRSNLAGIGVSSIGPIDYKKGRVFRPANLPFREIPVVGPLQKTFSLPVSFCNDCSGAAWGEKNFGAGKNYQNLVYITISSGIGGGAIVDGNLLLGKNRNAAEIGHFIVETKYNLPCGCGGKGHWEGYCSGEGLPRFFKYWLNFQQIKKKYKPKTAEEIFNLAKKRDKIVLKFLGEVGKINARGISNVILAYDPAIIIMGGKVFLENQEFILPYFKPNLDKFLTPPKIIPTPLNQEVCLQGAAALVFNPPLI